MIVLDASVIVDSLLPKLGDRHRIAKDTIRLISEHEFQVFLPRIARIELLSVLSRRIGVRALQFVEALGESAEFVGEEDFYQVAEAIAPRIQGRAVDLYYIALAFKTSSLLISCDRLQVENARKAGVEAYFLPREYGKLKSKLEKFGEV